MDLNSTRFFVQVVNSGSFTQAARTLGVPKSTVSDKVAELEKRLGVSLLTRSTRKLRLTDAGAGYFKRAETALHELIAASEDASRHQQQPTGTLRITSPAEHVTDGILRAVTEYKKKFPSVQVEIDLSNREVDLIAEGYDLAIRAGALGDSSLIARRIGTGKHILIASKSYLKSAPPLRHPRDLIHHRCLNFTDHSSGGDWRLRTQNGKQARVIIKPEITCNSFAAIKGLVTRGHGIGFIPNSHCKAGLSRGEFVHVLTEWASSEVPIHLVYPTQRYRSPTVQEMIPLITENLRELFE